MLNINKLKNISKNKKCFQSSLSKWSKQNDPNRLVDTTLNVDFAMHTDEEENPWWMVDLESEYEIEKIIIHNRKKQRQNRARTLKVEISLDGQRWRVVQQGFQYWGSRKDILIKKQLKARYVKISLEEKTFLHLSNMGVYTRDYFIVAGRNDGLGGRLQTILNALYISKNTGLKFAYTWKNDVNEYAKDFVKDQKIGNNKIIGHAIESEKEVFSDEFISKYSSTSHVNPNQGILRSKKLAFLSDILKEPLERNWGWYAPLDDLTKLFSKINREDYRTQISQLWYEIDFKDNIKALIKEAEKLASNELDFIAIHIRSGDIVYGGYRFFGKRFMKKALPLHLALGEVEELVKVNKQIVLFGDDNSSNSIIKNIYKDNIKLVDDFFPNRKLSNLERAIFEVTFMSKANQILASGASFFSNLASFIGNINGITSIYQLTSKDTQYEIYKKNLFLYKFHPYQMAFSFFHVFILGMELDKPLEELEQLIKEGLTNDPLNNKYLIFTIDILLKQNKIIEAENLILERLKFEKKLVMEDSDYKSLKETLIIKADNKYWHSFVFDKILKFYDNKEFPALSYLSYVIKDEKNGTSISLKKLQELFDD